jgi:hypothetical protein
MKKLSAAAALLALALAACNNSSRDAADKKAEAEGRMGPSFADASSGERAAAGMIAPGLDGHMQAAVDNRKVVRTGLIEIVVGEYDAARDQIDAMVREAGGFVDSTRVSHSEGQVSNATIVLRVPASQFGDLMPRLRALGEVQTETTDAADITDQYVDVKARLDSAKALEKRLHELASTRTGTVAEVLEVERELARVRGEIEQYEGRIRLWDDQVALSTLTVSLWTKAPVIAGPAAPGFDDRATSAWDDSIGALSDAGEGIVLGGIALLPWLPIMLPLGFLGHRWWRRRLSLPRAVATVSAPPPPPSPPSSDAV